MQGNILGQSGSSVNNSLFPIYQQTTEPYKKFGVWIKNSEIIKNLYFQNDIEREEVEEATLPYTNIGNRMVAVGNNIYLFGSGGYSEHEKQKYAYKYDTIEKEFTKLTDIPFWFIDGAAISIGTDIYLFGTRSSLGVKTAAYKYDTLSNAYTKLTSFPIDIYQQAITNIGEDIYFFGSGRSASDGDYNEGAYKYNIKYNTYTQLANIQLGIYKYTMSNGCAISADTSNIRIFPVSVSSDFSVLNYNILENNYTEITRCYGLLESITKLANKAYVISNPSDGVLLLKFDAKTNSFYQYTELTQIINEIVSANKKLYGVTTDKLYLLKNKIQNKGDGLYIVTNEDMLSKDMSMESILDVKKIVDGEEQELEVYIGDGEKWNLLN